MVVIKCDDCGGKLIKNSNIYVCDMCGKVFNKIEAEKDNLIEAFEITDCSIPGASRVLQMLKQLNMSGFFGYSKTDLATGETIELVTGEKIRIGGFYKLPKMKSVKSIEANTEAMIIIEGNNAPSVSTGTMLYKNK